MRLRSHCKRLQEEQLLKGGYLENTPTTKNTHEKVERLGNNKAESIIRAHMCSSELYNCAVDDNRNSDR